METSQKTKKPEKEKRTKILAIGDIHGDTGLVKKLAERAKKENVDIVIIAGDLTMAEISTKNLIGPFIKAKKQVLLIPGNHEGVATADFLAQYYNAKNIHGYSFQRGNLGIFGAGGGDIGIHLIKDSEVFELLKKGYERIRDAKKKIMVTHLQPKNTIIEKIGGFEGSAAVRRAIEKFQPDLAICAHIHGAGGIEEKIGKTTLINVSRNAVIFEI